MLLCHAATLMLLLLIAAESQAAGGSQELQQLKYTVKLLKHQVSDMTADVTAQMLGMTTQNTNLTSHNTNMRAQMTELTAKVLGITAQNTNLRSHNTNMRALMTELTAQLLDVTAQNIDLTAQNTNMRDQMTYLTAMVLDITAQNTNITIQLSDLTAHVLHLTAHSTNMTAHNANLTVQVAWLNEQHGFNQWVENNTFNEDQSKIIQSEITENPQSQDTSIQEPREWVTVIVGGQTSWSSSSGGSETDAVQVFGGDRWRALADYPHSVCHNRMMAIGSKVYSCGGRVNGKGTAECFMIDMKDYYKTWHKSQPLPRAIKEYHISGSNGNIMAIYEDGAISVNATIYAGFDKGSTSYKSCLVSNSTHSFFVHHGIVHMNANTSDPANWESIAAVDISGSGVACLLFDAVLYITRMDKLFMINTDTFVVVPGAAPNVPRDWHGMGVIDGRVAVLGGGDGRNYVDSIETYNRDTDKWQTNPRKLLRPLVHFGIVSLQL